MAWIEVFPLIAFHSVFELGPWALLLMVSPLAVPVLQHLLWRRRSRFFRASAVALVLIVGLMFAFFWLAGWMAAFDDVVNRATMVHELSGDYPSSWNAWSAWVVAWIASAVCMCLWELIENLRRSEHDLPIDTPFRNAHACRGVLLLMILTAAGAIYLTNYRTLSDAVAAGDLALAESRLRFNLEGVGVNDGRYTRAEVTYPSWQSSLLPIALTNDDKEMATFLIQHGADLDFNATGERDGVKPYSEDHGLILATPIIGDDIEMVEFMLDHGSNPNARTSNGDTPLQVAVLYDRDEVITLLVRRGADPKVKNHAGETALEYAKTLKNDAAASALLSLNGN